jgi:predicted nucleotidyltransferase
MTRESVLQSLAAQAPQLKSLGVKNLALFGSFAHGAERDDSDVDLLAEIEPASFDAYMDAKELLEERLHRKVDLVLRASLKPALRERILSDQIHVPGF